jgi:hypothetical protein
MASQGINICGFSIPGTKSCLSFYASCALYIELEGDGCEKKANLYQSNLKTVLE